MCGEGKTGSLSESRVEMVSVFRMLGMVSTVFEEIYLVFRKFVTEGTWKVN